MKIKIKLTLLILLIFGIGGFILFQTYKKLQKPRTVQINMKSGDFFFDPNVIRAKVGDTLEFNITNDGYHTFVIYEPPKYLSITKELSAKFETFSFKVDTPGTYEYFCDVAGHKLSGQKGTLIVEE